MKKAIGFICLAIFLFAGCNKEEGKGGEGSIKGVVFVKEYSTINNTFIRQLPAIDEDVYILYGSNASIGDKTTTSNSGTFEFQYLLDGTYKIYVYSSDSLFVQKNKFAVISDAKIIDGTTVNLDTLFLIKLVEPTEGFGQIAGKVFVKEYDKDFKYLQRTIPASDEDVFLSYSKDSTELDRVRTSYNGSFIFPNLLDNSYKIYVYQDDTSKIKSNNTSYITSNILVSKGNKIKLDTLFIYKSLDIDEGNSSISGKVWLVNYRANGFDIKDISVAQDYDVFLVYSNHTIYDMDTKTGHDGIFSFTNLLKGNYTIYVYSEKEDEFGNLTGATQKVIHKENITISGDNQNFFITDTVKSF